MADEKQTCLFCKIATGDIPSAKVYEDDACLAFMDIGPLTPGHLLLIPKRHCVTLWDMDPTTVASVTVPLARLAKAVVEATGAEGCNVLQSNGRASGQEIMHVHFHIIPRRSGDGLGYSWLSGTYAEGEMERMRKLILDKLV